MTLLGKIKSWPSWICFSKVLSFRVNFRLFLFSENTHFVRCLLNIHHSQDVVLGLCGTPRQSGPRLGVGPAHSQRGPKAQSRWGTGEARIGGCSGENDGKMTPSGWGDGDLCRDLGDEEGPASDSGRQDW